MLSELKANLGYLRLSQKPTIDCTQTFTQEQGTCSGFSENFSSGLWCPELLLNSSGQPVTGYLVSLALGEQRPEEEGESSPCLWRRLDREKQGPWATGCRRGGGGVVSLLGWTWMVL